MMDRKRSLGFAALAVVAMAGGCHLIIGYQDAVLDESGGGATCAVDGVKNGDETGKDCGGGLCPACADGEGCEVGPDCTNRVCIGGTCRPPACDDGVQNGAETDLDCGGGAASGCTGCPNGSPCHAGPDCANGVCQGDVCIDNLVWVRQFGRLSESSLAASSDGSPVLTGLFESNVPPDLGGGDLDAATYHFAIAQYDEGGGHVWSAAFGENGFACATDIAVDPRGNMLATGYFDSDGTLGFGGASLTSAGSTDMFLAKMTASGSHLWSKRFGDAQGQSGNAVATDAAGNLVVVGGFGGSINFGGSPLTGGGMFIAKLDPTGSHLWSQGFSNCLGDHVAATPSGEVVAAGNLTGAVDFGGGTLQDSGPNDRFFVKFSSSGTHIWSKHFSLTYLAGIAADADGDLVATGWFSGTVNFGGPSLNSATGGSSPNDAFVVKFGPSGEHLWSKRFGGPESDGCGDIDVDDFGNVILACGAGSPVDFGEGAVEGGFLVKLDADGNYVWSRKISDENGGISPDGIAAPDPAHIVLLGLLYGTVDLGAGPVTSQSYPDLILAKFVVP
uniref:Secreted protein n=1 Tax=Jahnella sp. MSr9139 TaxID=1434086 RepID=A0A3S7UW15_9BACT|nr:secreted protein [Jahnella sp. MSr9139]